MLLSCERLVIGFGGKPLLPPIDLQVRRGDFVAVVGRNGSGKSTWFKTLLGLQSPVSGRILKGRPGMKSAYVPQTAGIDAILPVRPKEMVLWGRMSGWNFLNPFPSREDRRVAEAALDTAGARAFAQRPYRELSEGQKQRTLLARVLASEADLVLLDEPTAAMDAVAERETMQRLAGLAHERRIAVVVVSHDLTMAAEHADTLLFLDREGPAVVVGDAPTVFCHPAFRHQYGDEYCARASSGSRLGPVPP
ncbi:metal ABC transporter ATP-binding protein [Hyalangium sp. s54d21]|uniref:Metal ABC transporter ATP-binding protein n=1 Tax=Hyalangium rubrum TaxID=3103134 RepID=A0ABU5GUI0_9BACT|nr:metal ABC transporter ATP-binding protein [Hyalangium sp. s54d21]MDY7224840.1 metal ABC transporter ATP-binding protein [Hyalangium sp. s54d21]